MKQRCSLLIKSSRVLRTCVALVLACGACSFRLTASAQGAAQSLRGTVVDDSGGAIGGAAVCQSETVAVRFAGRRPAQTMARSRYPNLPAGRYTVDVRRDLFEPATTNVELTATSMPVRVTMAIGVVRERERWRSEGR